MSGIKRRFIELEMHNGEAVLAMLLGEETETEYKGWLLYNSADYDDDTPTDYLGTGRSVTVSKCDVTGIQDMNDPILDRYDEVVAKKNKLKTMLINSSERVIQMIKLISEDDACIDEATHHDSLRIALMATRPDVRDKSRVPYMTRYCFYANRQHPVITKEILHFHYDHFRELGKFLPETKIMFKDDVICTFRDYSKDKLHGLKNDHVDIADQFISILRETELYQ